MKFRQRNGKSKRKAGERVKGVVSAAISSRKGGRGPKRRPRKSERANKSKKTDKSTKPDRSKKSILNPKEKLLHAINIKNSLVFRPDLNEQKIPAKQRRLFEQSQRIDNSKESNGKQAKLSLSTSAKDYGGNINLPETVAQRPYETTVQFMRRLNRLSAKAKVEAEIEARFEVNLSSKT